MSIFQKSVINKHLANLDSEVVEKAYQKFRENYNSAKIEEIRKLKEEQYQDGFLRDIFVDVFGYVLAPDENHNLAREFKNIANSKKADGAILKDGKAVAVIELKSTKTKDLKSVTEQAFGYKHNQPDCKYVIISNFHKLQFYIDYANEYEEFDLFNLQRDEFDLLYLLLNKESIFSDLPLKLKTETKFHEEKVSNELYKDYSIFKRKLFENLIKNNPDYDKLILFKKSQKLLDRFLFILFAEDSLLLPTNSISRVIKRYKVLKKEDAYKPLYEIYKQYFGYMNVGRKGETIADDIPAYNGGLFYPDELLESLIIDDDILISDLLKLSIYDFNTEVDVNILGHIFEHSLNEIEEITAEITATDATRGHVPLATTIDKKKSKRKKDGVFYTPKYITQYIVENTVGTLCKEKRKEFGIAEIEFDDSYYKKRGSSSSRGHVPLSEKGKKLFDVLEKYKEWLLTLKIVDPACGSGAFLNQALNFLIAEHKSIDDIIAELTNTPLRLFDTEKSILENNLYGVDINEESVEIAKLSLWLRTARKDRKLSNLNNNIKCGNSLIDDPEVAGDKAFNWGKEFPQIFREKKKQVWHITTATHNSRYSQRMFDYHVRTGEAIWIDEKDEIIITEAIAEIVKEDNLNVIEYNVCGDHLHMLLVCEKEDVSKIIGKIKAVSSRKRNIDRGITIVATNVTDSTDSESVTATRGHVPLSRKVEALPSSPSMEKEHSISPKKKKYNSLWTQKFGNSLIEDEEYLRNTISYIRNNRKKHELPENKELVEIIDSMTCSVEHAFRTEYYGGFDVVIGNPPYVQLQSIRNVSEHLQKQNFATFEKTGDLYVLFYELGIKILTKYGLLGFITSNKWMRAKYGKKIRKYFADYTKPKMLIDLGSDIFDSANVDSNILILEKKQTDDHNLKSLDLTKENEFNDFSNYANQLVNISDLSGNTWSISNPIEQQIKTKVEKIGIQLKMWNIEIDSGIKTGLTDAFIIDEKRKHEIILKDPKSDELIKPVLRGRDIKKYTVDYQNLYLINSHNGYKNIPKVNIENYPAIKEHLDNYFDKLEKRYDKGDTPYNLRNCAYADNFAREKIIYPDINSKLSFTLDNYSYYLTNTAYFLNTNSKYILSILNSSLINNYYSKISAQLGKKGLRHFTIYIEQIPIPKISSNDQRPFIQKADKMLELNKQFQQKKTTFLNRVKDNFVATATTTRGHVPLAEKIYLTEKTLKITKKLDAFYNFDFKIFLAELKKQKVKVSLKDQVEWEEFFDNYKTEINNLQSEIDKTDKEIDQMVYELYCLTEEEIRFVEGNVR